MTAKALNWQECLHYRQIKQTRLIALASSMSEIVLIWLWYVICQLERSSNIGSTYAGLLGAATVLVLAEGSFFALDSFALAPDFTGASSPESSRAAKKFDD
jgi:hypothetical protein